MNDTGSRRPLLLTAADRAQARTLSQFLLSVERQGEHRRCRIVVCSLGLAEPDLALLRRRFPWAELVTLAEAGLPRQASTASFHDVLMPVFLWQVAQGHQGPVLWFDGATILRQPLDEALENVGSTGFWVLRGERPITTLCEPPVLDALGVPLEIRHLRQYSISALGFDLATPLGRQLLVDWARESETAVAKTPVHHVAAKGLNHAVLNCLIAKAIHDGQLVMPRTEVDIRSACPTRLISTRNYVANGVPLWADPALRAAFNLRRALDVLYNRLRRWDDTRRDGYKRRRQEHFTVKLWRLPERREIAVPGPANGYYADPFITERDGKLWLFMEEFIYPEDCGVLTVLGLDDELRVTSTERIEFLPDYAALDSHASYPCIFELDGKSYMLPETHERRAIDLYLCEQWPARWRLRRRLRFGVDAADSMLWREGGLWYLLTSVQGDCPNRHLEIHYASDLFADDFKPHPVNAEKRYGSNRNGTGRNAGYIGRQADGTLVRLMQDSPNYYGEGIRPMRITALSPTEFSEEPIDEIDFLPGMTRGFRTHHATRSGQILAFDVRYRRA